MGLFKKKQKQFPEVYTETQFNIVDEHINQQFGEVKNVFHEIVSPDIHVDICIIEPTPERNYYTLVTLGMGAHRMNTPKDLDSYQLERAELAMILPPTGIFTAMMKPVTGRSAGLKYSRGCLANKTPGWGMGIPFPAVIR